MPRGYQVGRYGAACAHADFDSGSAGRDVRAGPLPRSRARPSRARSSGACRAPTSRPAHGQGIRMRSTCSSSRRSGAVEGFARLRLARAGFRGADGDERPAARHPAGAQRAALWPIEIFLHGQIDAAAARFERSRHPALDAGSVRRTGRRASRPRQIHAIGQDDMVGQDAAISGTSSARSASADAAGRVTAHRNQPAGMHSCGPIRCAHRMWLSTRRMESDAPAAPQTIFLSR